MGESGAARWAVVAAWAAVCAGSARQVFRTRGPERAGWLAVAVLFLALAAETAYPLRAALTDLLREVLRWVGGAEALRGRRPIQAAVIALVVAPALVLLVAGVARASRLTRAARVALAGGLVAAAGFVLEGISLHHLDQYPWGYSGFRLTGLALAAGAVGHANLPGRSDRPNRPPA